MKNPPVQHDAEATEVDVVENDLVGKAASFSGTAMVAHLPQAAQRGLACFQINDSGHGSSTRGRSCKFLGLDLLPIDSSVIEKAGFVEKHAVLVVIKPDRVGIATDNADLAAIRSVQGARAASTLRK